MKALKILKIIYKDCKDWNDKGFQTEYSADVLLEAIAELEALENRSCESCNCYENKARCDECSVNFDNLWESKC